MLPPGRRPQATVSWCSCMLFLAILLTAFDHGAARQFSSPLPQITAERLPLVSVVYAGPLHAAFARPLPHTVDPSLLTDFEDRLNRTQAFSASGDNTFDAQGQQFVVRITNGIVSGVLGTVSDSDGRVYAETTLPTSSLSALPNSPKQLPTCKRFKKLATTIQKFGHMYYHFLLEVLPRLVLAQPFLDADTKVLMFGSHYEAAWLAALGVDPTHVEVYDPTLTYCADELLVPTRSEVITPAKETLQLVRQAFVAPSAAPQPPASSRNLIVYCSRSGDDSRTVANEAALLATLRAAFPHNPLVVFSGRESVPATVSLFRHARVVIGMHGAGMAHLVFSEPGTAVVEFLFLRDPPMMFWHASAALGLQYWMVPLARSHWLAANVTVPEQDVVDALRAALSDGTTVAHACGAGYAQTSGEDVSQCTRCPAGMYRPADGLRCLPCGEGRFSAAGAAACRTCRDNTFALAARSCQACPSATNTVFPGASSAADCLSEATGAAALSAMFSRDILANKLLRIPALDAQLQLDLATPGPRQAARRLHPVDTSQRVHKLRLALLSDILADDSARRQSSAARGGRREASYVPTIICPSGQVKNAAGACVADGPVETGACTVKFDPCAGFIQGGSCPTSSVCPKGIGAALEALYAPLQALEGNALGSALALLGITSDSVPSAVSNAGSAACDLATFDVPIYSSAAVLASPDAACQSLVDLSDTAYYFKMNSTIHEVDACVAVDPCTLSFVVGFSGLSWNIPVCEEPVVVTLSVTLLEAGISLTGALTHTTKNDLWDLSGGGNGVFAQADATGHVLLSASAELDFKTPEVTVAFTTTATVLINYDPKGDGFDGPGSTHDHAFLVEINAAGPVITFASMSLDLSSIGEIDATLNWRYMDSSHFRLQLSLVKSISFTAVSTSMDLVNKALQIILPGADLQVGLGVYVDQHVWGVTLFIHADYTLVGLEADIAALAGLPATLNFGAELYLMGKVGGSGTKIVGTLNGQTVFSVNFCDTDADCLDANYMCFGLLIVKLCIPLDSCTRVTTGIRQRASGTGCPSGWSAGNPASLTTCWQDCPAGQYAQNGVCYLQCGEVYADTYSLSGSCLYPLPWVCLPGFTRNGLPGAECTMPQTRGSYPCGPGFYEVPFFLQPTQCWSDCGENYPGSTSLQYNCVMRIGDGPCPYAGWTPCSTLLGADACCMNQNATPQQTSGQVCPPGQDMAFDGCYGACPAGFVGGALATCVTECTGRLNQPGNAGVTCGNGQASASYLERNCPYPMPV